MATMARGRCTAIVRNWQTDDAAGVARAFAHRVRPRHSGRFMAVVIVRSMRTGELPRVLSGPVTTASARNFPCHWCGPSAEARALPPPPRPAEALRTCPGHRAARSRAEPARFRAPISTRASRRSPSPAARVSTGIRHRHRRSSKCLSFVPSPTQAHPGEDIRALERLDGNGDDKPAVGEGRVATREAHPVRAEVAFL